MNKSADPESCQHKKSDSAPNRIAAIGGGWKSWHVHRLRWGYLLCLLGLLATPLVYAFSPVPIFSSLAQSHRVFYVVYDPFGKKLSPASFGLPSEPLKRPHDSTRSSEDEESSDKTVPPPQMLQPRGKVATRDELTHHVQNHLAQFPNQPYVYVVQKVVRWQFGHDDVVVRAVALKIENPTFDRRRLRHFRIGGCS